MNGRGRKKIPDEMKKLKGTDQPCRMENNSYELPLITSIDEIETSNKAVLKTKRSKEIFIQKANQLIGLKILSSLDLEQLVIYAYSLDELFKCIDELKKGRFKEIYDENGHVLRFIENPYAKRYREMFDIVNKIGSDFGFNPVSRIKLKELFTKKEEKEKDAFDDL